jgi:CRP-like cAMP-binding protein
MSTLLLVGPWERLAPITERLHARGHAVTVAATEAIRVGDEGRSYHLLIAVVEDPAAVIAAARAADRVGCPWLALDGGDLLAQALEAGAAAVLPAGAEPGLLERTTEGFLRRHGATAPRSSHRNGLRRRTYRHGQPIPWPSGQVLRVDEGLVALAALHEDGREVLLGFAPAGAWLATGDDDPVALSLTAQDRAAVTPLVWEEAARQEGFSTQLRDQLAWMRSWAAMQARPHLEDRLTGILELLARQLGRPHPHGLVLDLRLTHSQLARAVGATRSTVSRLLSRLKRQGWLRVSSGPDGSRWIVRVR